MIYYLKYLVKSKWYFFKPRNKPVLIYDVFPKIEYLINEKEIAFFDKRNSVNFFVLIKTFLKTGLYNLKNNYIKNYFEIVSPKIVMTAVDNNYSFFKLKYIYKKAKYLCIQGSLRDKYFLNKCKEYYKKNKEKLKADYFFVYGKNDFNELKKYINAKFIIHGSFRNNLFTKKIKKKKIKEIIFISQAANKFFFNQEKNLVLKLIEVSRILNLKFIYLLKNDKQNKFLKYILDHFKKIYEKENFEYFIRERKKYSGNLIAKKREDVYNFLYRDAIFISLSSTFAFEALCRKHKVLFFPVNNFPIENYINFKKYKKEGIFWTKKKALNSIKKKVTSIINLNHLSWSRLINNYILDIINFQPYNKSLTSVLKKQKINILKNI